MSTITNAAEAVQSSTIGLSPQTTDNYPEKVQSFFENFWTNNQDMIIQSGKSLILIILVIIAAIVCIRILSALIHKAASKTLYCDETSEQLIRSSCKYVVAFFALLVILDLLGINTTSLLTILGTAGLAVGLALKDTLCNIAAGLVLLFMRPYNPGDYIECGSVSGTIKKMGLFASILTTPDGLFISVPNSVLWGSPIKNYNRNDTRRVDIVVRISYSDDIENGVAVLLKLMKDNELILDDPVPEVLIAELADNSVNLQLRFWTSSADYWTAYWQIKRNLKNTLETAGLNIPLPQRVLTINSIPAADPGKSGQ